MPFGSHQYKKAQLTPGMEVCMAAAQAAAALWQPMICLKLLLISGKEEFTVWKLVQILFFFFSILNLCLKIVTAKFYHKLAGFGVYLSTSHIHN